MPPDPPRYWPDDVMSALGDSTDGVMHNPSHRRFETDGQLGDVWIDGWSFDLDDEDDPSEVSVSFNVDDGRASRDLHLAVFTLPGPFDESDVDDQELVDVVSGEYDGGDSDTLTLSLS